MRLDLSVFSMKESSFVRIACSYYEARCHLDRDLMTFE